MKKLLVILLAVMLSSCGTAIAENENITVSTTTSAASETAAATKAPEITTKAAETTVTTCISSSETESEAAAETGLLSSAEDVGLYDADGTETNYQFSYGDEFYSVIYTEDNWKIIDSYKITSPYDMFFICEALISVHPIHGKDYVSFRTAEDMVFEWQEHNAAYMTLPDTSKWKLNTKDVDFDPEDQGKTGIEMALDRLQ